MKILHIVYDCTPGTFVGGVQKVAYELASAQARAGHEVQVWTINNRLCGTETSLEGGRLRIRYFRGRRIRHSEISSEMKNALLHGAGGFDVLHSHNTFHPLNLYVGKAARRHGVPAFYHPHGALDPSLFQGWGLRALLKKVYCALFEIPNLNRAAGVMALTANEATQVRSLGVKSPVHVMPNGIAPPPPPASSQEGIAFRSRLGIGADDLVLLFIGRIVAKKGILDLIDALNRLRESGQRAHLILCGNRDMEPAYTQKLDDAVAAAKLEDRVHWAGFLGENAKPAAYAAADIFVHASYSEGMAMAVLEAMSAGIPTLVTEGCYMGEAAKAGALLECKQGGAALAESIGPLLASPDERRRLGELGREYTGSHHEWGGIARRLVQIYEQARQPRS